MVVKNNENKTPQNKNLKIDVLLSYQLKKLFKKVIFIYQSIINGGEGEI